MAINRRTRRAMPAPAISSEDEAANRRISMRLFALPVVIERQLGMQFYLGGGVEAERRLLDDLRALDHTSAGDPTT